MSLGFLGLLLADCKGGPAPKAPPEPVVGTSLKVPLPPPRTFPPGPIVARDTTDSRLPLPVPRSTGAEEVVRVGSRSLTKSDLGDFVLRYFPDRAQDALTQLVEEAVVEAEAARERLTIFDAVLGYRAQLYLDERRRDARVQYGATTDFEAMLRERYGRDLASFRADSLRLVRTMLLRDRLIRLDPLREDGVLVRVLVLPSETEAAQAVASLREGADMTLYAERAGLRRPAAPAPATRGEIAEKDLATRLFASQPGDVLDPVPFEAPGGGRFWQVFKVVRTWRATSETWQALRAGVESSLDTLPVSEEEVRRWRRRAFARHEIKALDPVKGFVRPGVGE